jgi:hypothetical protein
MKKPFPQGEGQLDTQEVAFTLDAEGHTAGKHGYYFPSQGLFRLNRSQNKCANRLSPWRLSECAFTIWLYRSVCQNHLGTVFHLIRFA